MTLDRNIARPSGTARVLNNRQPGPSPGWQDVIVGAALLALLIALFAANARR